MRWSYLLFILFQHYSFAQNVQISDENNPNETAIIIHPKNPGQILAAANINAYYVSQDTGRNWTKYTLNSSWGVGGDPVLNVHPNGTFFFTHLSRYKEGNFIDRIITQSSTDGLNWSVENFTGLNGDKAQDKPWTSVDQDRIYLTWTEFDHYGSRKKEDSSRIMFAYSDNLAKEWSTPVVLNTIFGDCADDDMTMEGAMTDFDHQGHLYACWGGRYGLYFNRSGDKGMNWLSREMILQQIPGGWNYDIPGIYRCNGLPVLKVDKSNGPYSGTIYINWTDQRNGKDDTDVWLLKSEDSGEHWQGPIRVNNDGKGKHQFMSWMDIGPESGYIYIVFYDRRNHEDEQTDVYLAISRDGGLNFENIKISDSPFTPRKETFFGDYINIDVHHGIIRPVWTRLDGDQLSIWTNLSKEER